MTHPAPASGAAAPRSPGFYGLLFLATLLLYGAFSFAAEKILTNGGLGMDGVLYARITRDFARLPELGIPDLSLQRVLPAALVHGMLRLADAGLENREILVGFGLLNALSVAVGLVLLVLGMERLGLNRRMQLLGGGAFLLNFCTLKFTPYYPILTDCLAQTLSCGMLVCYLYGRRLLLAGLGLAASFTWPSALLMALLLLCLPARPNSPPNSPPPAADRRSRSLETVLAAAVTLLFLALSLAVFRWAGWQYTNYENIAMGVYQPDKALLPVSYALMLAYFFRGLLALLRAAAPFPLRGALGQVSPSGVTLAAALAVGSVLLRQALFHPSPSPDGFNFWQIRMIATLGVAQPGRFLVPHLLYFGPILLFTVFYWPRLCRLAAGWGLGLPVLLAFGLLQSLDSESRHLVHLFPPMLLFTLAAMQRAAGERPPGGLFTGMFLALSLACSRVWMRLGGEPLHSFDINDPGAQLYFMHQGPYVTTWHYSLQAAAAAACALILAALWRRERHALDML